jgi:hypothetical protein
MLGILFSLLAVLAAISFAFYPRDERRRTEYYEWRDSLRRASPQAILHPDKSNKAPEQS